MMPLVTSLANQFENAHLSEDAARSAFQEIDHAVAPEHKAWPPRQPFIMISLVFGALMGFLAIIIKSDWPPHRKRSESIAKIFKRCATRFKQLPPNKERLRDLKAALKGSVPHGCDTAQH